VQLLGGSFEIIKRGGLGVYFLLFVLWQRGLKRQNVTRELTLSKGDEKRGDRA
jgi:hypothetical protein